MLQFASNLGTSQSKESLKNVSPRFRDWQIEVFRRTPANQYGNLGRTFMSVSVKVEPLITGIYLIIMQLVYLYFSYLFKEDKKSIYCLHLLPLMTSNENQYV